MKIKILLISLTIVVIVYFRLDFEKNRRIDDYLSKQTKQFEIMYHTQYKHFKEKSRLIFDILIEKKEIINLYKKIQNSSLEQKDVLRRELYKRLKSEYDKLQYTKLEQVHFHLPSNESFLRVHRPSKFGDDLTSVRETVAYTNRTHEAIDGFESGRNYSGYRFVYPLLDKQHIHLGSVEISFNVSAFTQEFMEHFKVLSNFHIKKEIIDKKTWSDSKFKYYMKSPITGFYVERKLVNQVEKYSKSNFLNIKVSKDSVKEILKIMKTDQAISVFNEQTQKTKSFLPVRNPITNQVVAFLSITSDGQYVINEKSNFYKIFSLISLFIFIVSGLIYREFQNQESKNRLLDENLKQLETLQQQSKLASMGEMIGAIAHQWRQPLNAISMSIQNLDDDYEDGLIDEKFLDEFISKNNDIVKFMSRTIDDFRNFFRVDKSKEDFSVMKAIEDTLSIQEALLKNSYIEAKLSGNDFEIHGYKSEFQQVMLNLINNAKDEIIEKNIKEGEINITLNGKTITIEDNAGGVPSEIINRIFEPYFTTKEQGKGTGIGLYMSKMIIENNLGGKIKVLNNKRGAIFVIEL